MTETLRHWCSRPLRAAFSLLGFTALACVMSACANRHITPRTGEAYYEIMDRQVSRRATDDPALAGMGASEVQAALVVIRPNTRGGGGSSASGSKPLRVMPLTP